MASPFPHEAVSHYHDVLTVFSLPYFSIHHCTEHAVFSVPFPLTCLDHLLLLLYARPCWGVDNRTGNTHDCRMSFFFSRLLTLSANIKPRLLSLYQAISVLIFDSTLFENDSFKTGWWLRNTADYYYYYHHHHYNNNYYKTRMAVYVQACLWQLQPITKLR